MRGGGCYCSSGGTGRPRGVAEMLTSNCTGADTAAPPDTHGYGDFAGTPASGNAGSGLAVATVSGSQGLDYNSVLSLWQTGSLGGQVPGVG